MKILLSIPCLFGAEFVKEAICSVSSEKDVDLLLIDNGADEATKNVLNNSIKENVFVIHNEKNIYVNAAWQQAIDFFLNDEQYSHIVIMNSDLIMQEEWSKIIFNRLAVNEDEIIIPIITDDKNLVASRIKGTNVHKAREVTGGTPGVFILFNRKQAKIISPLPHDICKVWFGDEYIYSILRTLGYKTVIPDNLYCYHLWSATLNQVEGVHAIIEQDKVNWENFGRQRALDIIMFNE